MVEFSGAGLDSLSNREDTKRKMMATLGARLLEDRPAQAETFGAVAMRHAAENASLRTLATSEDEALSLALRIHAWWQSTATDISEFEDVSVDVNKDFVNVKASPQEVAQAMLLVQSELMSYDWFYWFIQQGEWGRPGVSVEDELAAIVAGNSRMPAPAPAPEPEPEPEPEPGVPA
jgi:hypothetical protein